MSFINVLSLGVTPMLVSIQLCLRIFNFTLTFLSILIHVLEKMQATIVHFCDEIMFFPLLPFIQMHMMINISLNLLIETWI